MIAGDGCHNVKIADAPFGVPSPQISIECFIAGRSMSAAVPVMACSPPQGSQVASHTLAFAALVMRIGRLR